MIPDFENLDNSKAGVHGTKSLSGTRERGSFQFVGTLFLLPTALVAQEKLRRTRTLLWTGGQALAELLSAVRRQVSRFLRRPTERLNSG